VIEFLFQAKFEVSQRHFRTVGIAEPHSGGQRADSTFGFGQSLFAGFDSVVEVRSGGGGKTSMVVGESHSLDDGNSIP
jgi:hypothetical protein